MNNRVAHFVDILFDFFHILHNRAVAKVLVYLFLSSGNQ